MYGYVQLCTVMYSYVQLCTVMYSYVQLCTSKGSFRFELELDGFLATITSTFLDMCWGLLFIVFGSVFGTTLVCFL